MEVRAKISRTVFAERARSPLPMNLVPREAHYLWELSFRTSTWKVTLIFWHLRTNSWCRITRHSKTSRTWLWILLTSPVPFFLLLPWHSFLFALLALCVPLDVAFVNATFVTCDDRFEFVAAVWCFRSMHHYFRWNFRSGVKLRIRFGANDKRF